MNFHDFAKYLEKIENTNGRTDMTKILAELFGQLEKSEIKYTMYLLQGRLIPKFVPIEFNFSQKLMVRALGKLIENEDEVKKLFNKLGDAGLVAENIITEYKPKFKPIESSIIELENTLNSEVIHYDGSILSTYHCMRKIAMSGGKGSQEAKMNFYNELVTQLDSLSARYVSRMIVGSIRLGVSDKTVLDALSWFKTGDKSIRASLDSAFGKKADIGELAESVLTSTDLAAALSEIHVKPGIPIASKLVEREISAQAVWERMPNCYVQPKLDGLRGQLHYSKKNFSEQLTNTAIYSRNMETMTDQFPEIVLGLSQLNIDSIILDSEIIGYNDLTEEYMTYQETMQRRRKYDIGEYSRDIPVRAMCFDILYLNGQDLTQEPLEKRIEILKKIVDSSKSALRVLQTQQMNSESELEEYFTTKVESGLEGIITKQLGTHYEPGTRNFKWIKLKANTRSDLVDTIDVVVLGYYIGKGDRSRFGFGTLLAGVYGENEDKYYSIGKVGSGFKEDQMEKIFLDLQLIKLDSQPENVIVEKSLHPDVWVEPKIIMEIIADEITRSPSHTAARGIKSNVPKDDSAKGLSIRFPRMKIWNREDKNIPNSVSEIVRMYELRKGK